MRLAVYPGTFDPVTKGHLDLVRRGLMIFDELIIAVALNPRKNPLFTLQERFSMIEAALRGYSRVRVESFDGLLVDYVKEKGGVAIIRGLRAISDFEYEMQMALMNRRLAGDLETVFMMPSEEYSYLTSTIVKEVASLGGSVAGLVPEGVERALEGKFGPKRS